MLRIHQLDGSSWKTTEGEAGFAGADLDSTAWVEVIAPEEAERNALIARYNLHAPSLSDALTPEHPPTFREFDDHIFVIVHAPENTQDRQTRKVALFLAERWIVTIVRQPLPLLTPLFEQMSRHPRYYLAKPELIAHAILNHMADIFEERIDEMIDRSEQLEEEALERAESTTLRDLHELRRRSSYFSRIVRTQRDVCQALARGGCPVLSREVEPYMRDLADHMLRIYDLLEAVRDGILAARDGYLTAVNNQLNVSIRTLTAVATILVPLGLITGIFGMNFEHIPGLHHPYGFPIVLGVMATLGVSVFVWLRTRKWL